MAGLYCTKIEFSVGIRIDTLDGNPVGDCSRPTVIVKRQLHVLADKGLSQPSNGMQEGKVTSDYYAP